MQGRQHVHTPPLPLIQLPSASNFSLSKDAARSGRALSNWPSPWALLQMEQSTGERLGRVSPVLALWQQRGQSSLCSLPSGAQGARAEVKGKRVSVFSRVQEGGGGGQRGCRSSFATFLTSAQPCQGCSPRAGEMQGSLVLPRAGVTRLHPGFVQPPLGSSFMPEDLCGIAAQQRKGLF